MVTRGERRRRLHAALSDLGSGCEFPGCREPATQMAHLHSIGMGGRASADTLDNVMRACADHALLTDGGIPGHRGRDWYQTEVEKLTPVPGLTDPHSAWDIAEALRVHIRNHRPHIVLGEDA